MGYWRWSKGGSASAQVRMGALSVSTRELTRESCLVLGRARLRQPTAGLATVGASMLLLNLVQMHVLRRWRLTTSYGGGFRGGPNNDPTAYGSPALQNALFRFNGDELWELCGALRLFHGQGVQHRLDGSVVVEVGNTTFGVMEALLITLHRLASGTTQASQVQIFRRNVDVLSRAFQWVVRHYELHFDGWIWADKSLTNAGLKRWKPQLHLWADASSRKGLCVQALGFVDGTRFETSRPNKFQELFYNGYYGRHCVNAVMVVAPNGIIIYLAGPDLGTSHDGRIMNECNFIPSMRKIMPEVTAHFPNPGFVTDCAFAPRKYIYPMYRHGRASSTQRAYNKNLASLGRITSEWANKEVKEQWRFVNSKRVLQVHRRGASVTSMLRFAAFLANCKCCLRRGNQISIHFGVDPPTLKWFLKT